jgi:hypothetical protein
VLQLSVEYIKIKVMNFNLFLCTGNVIRFETYIPAGFLLCQFATAKKLLTPVMNGGDYALHRIINYTADKTYEP